MIEYTVLDESGVPVRSGTASNEASAYAQADETNGETIVLSRLELPVHDVSLTNASASENIRIARIKRRAGEKITAIAPEWKQRNLLARSIELQEIITSGGTLTAAEQAEMTAITDTWEQIKQIRAISNAAEQNGTSLAAIDWSALPA